MCLIACTILKYFYILHMLIYLIGS
uniref:Uncharacterized protein n=1 Tax=Anguilla anguilla TaxID=7936 RepID=A0A0E9XPQ6_ANGAN